MDKFTDSQNLRARKTPQVVVTENDYVVARRVYAESLTKKAKRLKFMEDYKTDLSFQSSFKHVNYHMKFPEYYE